MKTVICLVTHNRLELTKLALESLLNTTSNEYVLVVVDNQSTDGTAEWLREQSEIDLLIEPGENLYPGRACNLGWKRGLELLPDADFLMRSDNDIFYHWRWDAYIDCAFQSYDQLGLMGILDLGHKFFWSDIPNIPMSYGKVGINRFPETAGGGYLMRKKLWDEGFKHIEEPWGKDSSIWDEDRILCNDIHNAGYVVGHPIYHIATHLGVYWGYRENKLHADYYRHTSSVRDVKTYEEFVRGFEKKS